MSTKEVKKTTKTKASEAKVDSKVDSKEEVKKVSVKPSLGKKKLVVSYKNLPADIVDQLKEKYPKGYADVLMKIDKGGGQFFYAITLDTPEIDYLIKVDVKIDTEMEEVERQLFGGSDQSDDFSDNDADESAFDQAEEAGDDDDD